MFVYLITHYDNEISVSLSSSSSSSSHPVPFSLWLVLEVLTSLFLILFLPLLLHCTPLHPALSSPCNESAHFRSVSEARRSTAFGR